MNQIMSHLGIYTPATNGVVKGGEFPKRGLS